MSKHSITKNIQLFTIESPIEFVMDDGTVSSQSFPLLTNKPLTNQISESPIKSKTHVSETNKYDEKSTVDGEMPPVIIYQHFNTEQESDIEPRYNEYKFIKRKINYKDNIDNSDFKNLLFGNKITAINENQYDDINNFLDLSIDDEKMRVLLKFDDVLVDDKNGVLLVEKVFTKLEDGNVSYYYDNKIPSIVIYKNNCTLQVENNFFVRTLHHEFNDRKNKETYLKCYHYFNLNILVYVSVNFKQDRLTPAIIITDEKENPIEIHYFYKNQYIPSSLINQIKPNLLNENFKEDDYFSARDIIFIDMIIFK